MFNISGYLSKYKKIGDEQEINKIGLLTIIKKLCNISLEGKQVVIKKSVAIIKANSAQKSQIHLKKEKITKALEEGMFSITQIKY